MNRKYIIFLGGGGHCKSVIDVAENAGYTILGVLDKPEKVGKSVLDYKVIGTDEDIPQYVGKAEFVITVGQIQSCEIRKKLSERIENAGGRLATVIADDAYVSKYADVGAGTVIMHKAFVNAGVKVGRSCIINTMTNLEHDVVIGDFCHVSTGSMINGEAKVGNESFIGSHSVLYNCISVCDNTIIAAGSVVNRDITISGIYAGNPVRFIK